METVHRGRPRRPDIDSLAREHALALLAERGYDGLRMKDVAESAGIGLGALYRRWAGKKDLVMAALRADVSRHETEGVGDPLADLVSALERIAEAMPRGLGRLVAACLSEPDSELAQVAREAKLTPMTDALTARLEKVTGPAPDVRLRAESGLAYLLWKTATGEQATDEHTLRNRVLTIMGVSPQTSYHAAQSAGTSRHGRPS
ncbi:TetR/AcrR family transcriptional regulator [Actinoallomurus rhizosphaericola]|uniref:TetR/AcrR family transcriptional regulator n=1 Tax=Actinoallomurus rhizosphaericola TaxID=2952536 RepID=UPI002092F876|nr:TetR/AcrR family transcriptional regulator [Actinoallomurus rhizosphaericola]MCO5999835.1 TetR/AcrR family transcriptional regulator [Actinoallomurus rhizosphaericola]